MRRRERRERAGGSNQALGQPVNVVVQRESNQDDIAVQLQRQNEVSQGNIAKVELTDWGGTVLGPAPGWVQHDNLLLQCTEHLRVRPLIIFKKTKRDRGLKEKEKGSAKGRIRARK